MSNMIDLSLLTQDTINIKFDEDTVFRIPPEPSIGFSSKMLLARNKLSKAKSEEQQLKILAEFVELILSQDTSHDNVNEIVQQLHPSQVEAVFAIYEEQVERNKQSKN